MKSIRLIWLTVVSICYSLLVRYLSSFSSTGDSLKYRDFYEGVHVYDGLAQILAYQNATIGSLDPLYALLIRFGWSEAISFDSYVVMQAGIYAFCLGLVVLKTKKKGIDGIRVIILGVSLLSIYSLGMATTLLRLEAAMIFVLIGVLVKERRRSLGIIFYLCAILTHITTIFLAMPLVVSSPPARLRPYRLLTLVPSISKVRIGNLVLVVGISMLFAYLARNKISTWAPVVAERMGTEHVIDTIVIVVLTVPLMVKERSRG